MFNNKVSSVHVHSREISIPLTGLHKITKKKQEGDYDEVDGVRVDGERVGEDDDDDDNEEEADEDEDDLFNTEYVNEVTSGELKLVYVPDSPTEAEADAGDDPFDTSVVERIVGPLPVVKKKRALVSIGDAAGILQRRAVEESCRPRRPAVQVQLLAFEDEPQQAADVSSHNAIQVTAVVQLELDRLPSYRQLGRNSLWSH